LGLFEIHPNFFRAVRDVVPVTPIVCFLAISISATGFSNPASPLTQPKCPFCQMAVLNDTATTDYRVTLTSSGKTSSYRCVLCAVADAKGLTGNLQIDAASEVKGHPVHIVRESGKWSILPENSVFVYAEGDHEQCQTRYRALTSADAFKAYVESNPKVLKNAKQLSLAQFIKLAG
jgi:hypothetical protein